MRVGVVGPVGVERFAENIADGLERMGLEAIRLGPTWSRYQKRLLRNAVKIGHQAMPGLEARVQQRIARSALDCACDVVINVEPTLMPSVVSRLRSNGVRVAYWSPDPVTSLGRALMLLAPYDAIFFKEPHIVERLRANTDLPVYYLPEACNPRWHRPAGPVARDPCLVMVGNMYPSRLKLLERLIARGIPLKVYGSEFPRWIEKSSVRTVHAGRSVLGAEKAAVYRSAGVVLNTMNLQEIAGVNGRLFHAAGSGAAVLTEFRPALPELFDIGPELLTYRNFDELVDQATRILADPSLAGRLGDAAAERAHQDHVHERRLEVILEMVA
jgi:spore maturation protein CgeB